MRKLYIAILIIICGLVIGVAVRTSTKNNQLAQTGIERNDFTVKLANGQETGLSSLADAPNLPAITTNFVDAVRPPDEIARAEEVAQGSPLDDGWYAIYGITEFLTYTGPKGTPAIRTDTMGEKVGHHYYHLKKSRMPFNIDGYKQGNPMSIPLTNSPELFARLPYFSWGMLPNHPNYIAIRIVMLELKDGKVRIMIKRQK